MQATSHAGAVRSQKSANRRCADTAAVSGRPAFTIVELLIVVLVTGVLAAVAIPAFVESLLFHRVESAARRIKSDLELVQKTARLTSAPQKLTVLGLTYSATPAVTSFDRPGTIYAVDLSKSPYYLSVLAANFGGLTEVTFDGYGKPSSGGTIIVQARNSQCTVTLDSTTGQATITSNHSRARSAKVVSN